MNSNSKYEHLFFDLDHTLWDFEENSKQTLNYLYQEFKLCNYVNVFIDFYECYTFINKYLWSYFLNGHITHNEFQREQMRLTLDYFNIPGTDIVNEMNYTFSKILPTKICLMPFAIETLNYLKDRYIMNLLTNGTDDIQIMKLKLSGIDTYFSNVITATQCKYFKPDVRIFNYASNKVGAKSENCIMIGDSLEFDIIGAQSAGWDQVYYNSLKIVHKFSPTFEINSLKEIMNIL